MSDNKASQAKPGFDMVRITKAKREVDFNPNTIRSFAKEGLPLYKHGRCTVFSRRDLEAFLRSKPAATGA